MIEISTSVLYFLKTTCYHLAMKTSIRHKQESYTYRVIIEPDERSTFHGYVPALPGCHTWGATIEDTRRNIRDAIDAYVRALRADGEHIPEDVGIEAVETIFLPVNISSSAIVHA